MYTETKKQKELIIMTIQQLEQVIARYGTEIYSFCRYLAKDKNLADELYQDTWITVMRNINKIDHRKNAKSYILSVALRTWKNQRRKSAWRNRIAPCDNYMEIADTIESDQSENSLDLYLQKEQHQKVLQAIEHLPKKQQIVTILYYMEELSIGDISDVLHIPAGTVKSRLAAARKKLGQELEAYINE